MCPSDFLFFYTSEWTDATDYVDVENRSSLPYVSNDPFNCYLDHPLKKRRVIGKHELSPALRTARVSLLLLFLHWREIAAIDLLTLHSFLPEIEHKISW